MSQTSKRGRPKLISDEELCRLIDEYVANELEGNFRRLKKNQFAEYVRTQGYDIEDRIIYRSETLKDYIRPKTELTEEEQALKLAVFHSLDIRRILEENTPGGVIRIFTEREQYYQHLSYSASQALTKYKDAADENVLLKQTVEQMKAECASVREELKKATRLYRMKEAEAKQLERFIKSFLYDEIANEFLAAENALAHHSDYVDPVKLEKRTLRSSADITDIENAAVKELMGGME